ncbi:peptide chain release factor 1 [Vicingus serpentipes]|jgi:peptide chain release factor 1|uniref:Peptide chain release factor 1 n=1 Tax=Vicingus serpentipes TaxID=1926625 RepID=A0A5C6RST7_9FLAO|nr:peptide chain release factor 1 [Vicingus serpentipes]TXB65197.1 peptide chain release factor 1 [Vicingus serpentipes]
MSDLLNKLEAINIRYEQVSEQIVDPEVINDMKRYVKLNKEYKDLQLIVDALNKYKNILGNIENSKEVIETETDREFVDMAKQELDELLPEKEKMEEEIKVLLIPKDEEDSKNVIVEIRAGAGGDEASIFVGDLYKMYSRYIDKRGWKSEVLTVNEGTAGGYKEVSFSIEGEDIYSVMKFESGVHRVQRVPQTESQGRVHTSAVTVAVLPEAEEVDIEIRKDDIKKDTYRSSGAGGQHVNKTESAVRLTHIPTGVVVECQEGRSQIKNMEIAMKVLRSRLYEAEIIKKEQERAAERKSQVSTGDRSAKIRTYNYPQGRVTDHRIGLTLYNLDGVMGGDIDAVIDALKIAENTEKLKAGIE